MIRNTNFQEGGHPQVNVRHESSSFTILSMLTDRILSTLLRSQETHLTILRFYLRSLGSMEKSRQKINMLVMVIRIWLTQTRHKRVECVTASNDAAQELWRTANVM